MFINVVSMQGTPTAWGLELEILWEGFFLVFKLKTLSISKYINSVHRSNALAISHNTEI